MLTKFFDKLSFKPDPVRMYSAGQSNVGRRRKLNEDNFLIDEKLGLFVVADGMGGHDAGEVASKLAIETLFNFIKQLVTENPRPPTQSNEIQQVLQDAIEEANNQTHCYNIAKGIPEGQGMGTTLSGFWLGIDTSNNQKIIYSFNVGDSRTYSFFKGKLKQLSTDHSHYQLWIETGKEGPAPKHNIIYKAIGPWSKVVAEQHIFATHEDELFLLCSDGLCDMVSDVQIQTILQQNKTKPLNEITQVLIDAANNAGGKDNITVILVKPR